MQTLKQKQSLITANHKEIENLPLATRKDYLHLIMCINTAKNTKAFVYLGLFLFLMQVILIGINDYLLLVVFN